MYVNQTNKDMADTMARLSSGKRINTAADDSAGMAIASRMEAQVRGLNQAIRNAADGQALIDTTEGAHQEVTSILQRMRELAVQAANDTNVTADRVNIQAEVTQLQAEIDRIAGQTTWNGVPVLDNSFTDKQLQIGADGNQTLSFSVSGVSSSLIGTHQIEAEGFATMDAANATAVRPNAAVANGYVIQGSRGTGTTAAITGAESAKQLAAAVNAITSTTGVSATAVTNVKIGVTTVTGNVNVTGFSLGGTVAGATDLGDFTITATDLTNMRDAINAKASTTGITAKFGDSKAELILTDADGDDIVIDDFETSANDTVLSATVLKADGVTPASALTGTTTAKGGTVIALKDGNASGFQQTVVSGSVILSDTAQITVTGGVSRTADAVSGTAIGANATSSLQAVSGVDVSTVTAAANSIARIDGAIDMVNARRAELGAISNRLDNTMTNLSNIAANAEASRSQIEDADFAAESANLAKQQIMLQAGTAMLAQANASQQNVLSLIS
jgi:flagellin